MKLEKSYTLAHKTHLPKFSKMKEVNFSNRISQYLNSNIVNMTLFITCLVDIIDRIKHDIYNHTTLHDLYDNPKDLINGIQVLKSTIGTYPRLPHDTLWYAISDISLVFDSTNLSAIDK